MITQENKNLVARIPNEAFNQRKFEVFDELFSNDFVNHMEIITGGTGREGIKQLAQELLRGFSDFKYTINQTVCEGNLVVNFVTATGTHDGEFMGIQPTGKKATWNETHIVRVENNRIVEHWGVVDKLAMLQQLGIIPADIGGELA